jgi:RecA-family ATPase
MNIINSRQLLNSAKSEIKWLVEGLIKTGSIGFIAGEPKTSKSWLALHIAQAVATGTPVLGHFKVPAPAPVLFIEEEDAYETVIVRLKALAAGHALPEPGVGHLNFIIQSGYRINSDLLGEKLIGAIRASGASLVILDVLNKLHNYDDNSQKYATVIMGVFEHVRRETGAAILIVHHFAKGSTKKRGNQRMRGSSVFAGWSENSLYLTKDGVLVGVEPENKFAMVESFGYRFNAVNNGLRLEYLSAEDTIIETKPLISTREIQRRRDIYKKRHHIGGR